MQLTFKYDLQKDTENFLKSFNSVHSKTPTKLQQQYIHEVGSMDAPKASDFLQKQGIDIDAKLQEIESNWRKVESVLLPRMEEMFGIRLFQPLTVYLSTNSRCRYSIENNYFFVYMQSRHPNGGIAHELLHFYTWYAFHAELESKGISKERYGDIKEALTELLNTDFQDLLPGYEDKGYPQHQEMRTVIRQMRDQGKGVKEIVLGFTA